MLLVLEIQIFHKPVNPFWVTKSRMRIARLRNCGVE